MKYHIYCAISSHGYGHVAQVAPVLNQLKSRYPDLQLTIQCAIDAKVLASWINSAFTQIEEPADLGLLMHDAVHVDAQGTYQAYHDQLLNWQSTLNSAVKYLECYGRPDLVVTNNSYIMSAAAFELGIPSLHFCSLNWAALFRYYSHQYDQGNEVFNHLVNCYNRAENFLRITPGLEMSELNNVKTVGPIGRTGACRDLSKLTGRSPSTKFVLVSMGGIPYHIPYESWPAGENICWLTASQVAPEHPDFLSLDKLNISFIDAVASCDAIVTKPGYGTFVEATIHHKPVLYLSRKDWPEEPYLVSFLNENGIGNEISPEQLSSGRLKTEVEKLLLQSSPQKPVSLTGIAEVTEEIIRLLKE
ncbi:hypothetical protein [Hahella ganghwensis]|uniref:hypothetical protein n=1 Tax=Hahella ganghwensis TaxID=286420 RepID=UPI0012FC6711|nr:hypothetical protein [Hahella ganghwensis]